MVQNKLSLGRMWEPTVNTLNKTQLILSFLMAGEDNEKGLTQKLYFISDGIMDQKNQGSSLKKNE